MLNGCGVGYRANGNSDSDGDVTEGRRGLTAVCASLTRRRGRVLGRRIEMGRKGKGNKGRMTIPLENSGANEQ